MALFKTTFKNELTNLSNKQTASPKVADVDEELVENVAETHELPPTSLSEVIAEAPEPVAKLLRAITHQFGNDHRINARKAAKLVSSLRMLPNGRLRKLPQTNERLCRIAGVDPNKVDLASMTREYLQERLHPHVT
jgi:hypothetical protein